MGKCGLNCTIYATVPVYKMGQMFMYDLHQSRHNFEEFTLFSLDDIDLAFGKVTQLKYSQSVSLKGRGQGLTIIPLPAGHMIGGTIWKITKEGEEEIVYAMDFNHKRERHLNGCVLETIRMPSVLIVDAYNANYAHSTYKTLEPKQKQRPLTKSVARKDRDGELMDMILQTVRRGGNALVAVDTAGRVLELAYMLDQFWREPESGLMTYSFVLLSFMSLNVIEFAKSQVEWMSDKIMRSFEGQRNNPFQFKYLQLCNSIDMLAKVREPYVVLASQPDLESGFSRQLFAMWAQNPNNSIILTQRSSPNTLSSKLREFITPPIIKSDPNTSGKVVTLEIKQRIPLQGLALEEYLRQHQNDKKEPVKEESDSDDAASDDETANRDKATLERMNSTTEARHDLMMPKAGDGKSKGSFFKQAKKSYPMYPCIETKIKWDDYGEVINPEDYMIFDHTPGGAKRDEENKENKQEEEPAMEVAREIPTQCVSEVQTLNVKASVAYIDFEGRSDGESLKKIISMIKPRRLILVHGSVAATDHLAAYCESSKAVIDKMFTPRVSDVVDATTESHIYQVRLKDSLVTSLHFSRAKDGAELAWVEAELEMAEEESLLPQEQDSKTKAAAAEAAAGGRELLPTLKQLLPNEHPSHINIFVNELKLSDFKQVLVNAGIQAEFVGGVLYCNNQVVAVRRNEAGRIHLEGTVCEDYFRVRELLYQQYAVV